VKGNTFGVSLPFCSHRKKDKNKDIGNEDFKVQKRVIDEM
jgi:hypothetical protein